MTRRRATLETFTIDCDTVRAALCVNPQEVDPDDGQLLPYGDFYIDGAGFIVTEDSGGCGITAVGLIGKVPKELHGAKVYIASMPLSAGKKMQFVKEGRGYTVKSCGRTIGLVMSTGARMRWRNRADFGIGGYTLRRTPQLDISATVTLGRISSLGVCDGPELQFTTAGITIAGFWSLNLFVICGGPEDFTDSSDSIASDWIRESMANRAPVAPCEEKIVFPFTVNESQPAARATRKRTRTRG